MSASTSDSRPHLLFLVTEDWAFWRHRRPMARAARDAGFRVSVACRVRDHGALIKAEGFRVLPLPWDRPGANPLKELALMGKVAALLRREKPDLVHNVAIKPAVHGGFGALLAGTKAVVTTMAGMGFVYISDSPKARILRPIITTLFRVLLNRRGRLLMVQNADDRAFRSVELLDEAMAMLATEPKTRACVVDGFSAEAIGDQTVALYRTLLDRRTAP